MLTPREKSPLPENVPRGGSNPRRCGQRAQALPTELFRPPFDSDFITKKHLMMFCGPLCSVGKLLFECVYFCLHVGDSVCGSGQLCLNVCERCESAVFECM